MSSHIHPAGDDPEAPEIPPSLMEHGGDAMATGQEMGWGQADLLRIRSGCPSRRGPEPALIPVGTELVPGPFFWLAAH